MRDCAFLRPLLCGVAVFLGFTIPPTLIAAPTLAEVFAALDTTDTEVWTARINLADAQARRSAARSIPNPTLFGTGEELAGGGLTTRETTMGVRQDLGFLWSRRPALNAASSSLEAARWSLAERRLESQSAVLLDLIRLEQLAREQLLLDTLTATYQRVADHAAARSREGDISTYEAQRVGLIAAEIHSARAALSVETLNTLSELQRATGWPASALIGTSVNGVLDIPFADATGATAYAREHSPDLRRRSLEEQGAISSAREAAWRRLPAFSVGIGRKETNLGEDGLYLEGEIELPLFQQRTGAYRLSRVHQQRASTQRRNGERLLEAEVHRAFHHWKSLQELPMSEIRDEHVIANLRAATSLYLSGEAGHLELLDAVASSLATVQALSALEQERWRADLVLRRATGYPIIEEQ